jgi:hypothetical protein
MSEKCQQATWLLKSKRSPGGLCTWALASAIIALHFVLLRAVLRRSRAAYNYNRLESSGAGQMVRRKPYVFDHYVFVSRRGAHPNHWAWEIRCKSKPDRRSVSQGGCRSAQAAEEAGKIALAIVREAVFAEPAPPQKIVQPKIKRPPLTPEQRSENARKAAKARALALSPQRRLEISRKGGAASKGKPKTSRRTGLPIRKMTVAFEP